MTRHVVTIMTDPITKTNAMAFAIRWSPYSRRVYSAKLMKKSESEILVVHVME